MSGILFIELEKIGSDLEKIVKNPKEFTFSATQIIEKTASDLGLSVKNKGYSLISGEVTTLYQIIIEYAEPKTSHGFTRARTQIINHIKSEAQTEERFAHFLGIIFSDTIGFVKFDPLSHNWTVKGPYTINRNVILKILIALRGLERKRLFCEELAKDFGPQSDTTKRTVSAFYDSLNLNNPKAALFFETWMKTFSQIGYREKGLHGLEKHYRIGEDCTKLLFCIHTFYALLVKLIAAEAVSMYTMNPSYTAELGKMDPQKFKKSLEDLEEGIPFKTLIKITNFIEGDCFSWYLDEFEKVMNVIAEIAKILSEYEFVTPVLNPEGTADVLKTIYQTLIPGPIRHNLGEYYTPEWLAQILLDRVGFTVNSFKRRAEEFQDAKNPLSLRLLDPA